MTGLALPVTSTLLLEPLSLALPVMTGLALPVTSTLLLEPLSLALPVMTGLALPVTSTVLLEPLSLALPVTTALLFEPLSFAFPVITTVGFALPVMTGLALPVTSTVLFEPLLLALPVTIGFALPVTTALLLEPLSWMSTFTVGLALPVITGLAFPVISTVLFEPLSFMLPVITTVGFALPVITGLAFPVTSTVLLEPLSWMSTLTVGLALPVTMMPLGWTSTFTRPSSSPLPSFPPPPPRRAPMMEPTVPAMSFPEVCGFSARIFRVRSVVEMPSENCTGMSTSSPEVKVPGALTRTLPFSTATSQPTAPMALKPGFFATVTPSGTSQASTVLERVPSKSMVSRVSTGGTSWVKGGISSMTLRRSVPRVVVPPAGVNFTGMSTSPLLNAVLEDGRITVSVPSSLRKFQLKTVFVTGSTTSFGCSCSPSTTASGCSQKFVVSKRWVKGVAGAGFSLVDGSAVSVVVTGAAEVVSSGVASSSAAGH